MDMRMDSTTQVEREQKKRGFTLTEIAIVLGIIGLILGAIWVAAAAVYTNMRVARSSQELLQITQAIRSLYATSTVTGAADKSDITASLIPAGVFPTDSLPTGSTSTIVNSPWSGSQIHIYSHTIAAAGDAFIVSFEGIPSQGCINLQVSSTGSGRDPGMIAAMSSSTSWGGVDGATSPAPTAGATGAYYYLVGVTNGVPASVAAASSGCSTSTSTTSAFLFRLRV